MNTAGIDACMAVHKKESGAIQNRVKLVEELGLNPKEYAIVLASADDEVGNMLAQLLLPEKNWECELGDPNPPYLKGIVERESMAQWIKMHHPYSSERLLSSVGLVVLVVAHGAAVVFPT